MFGKIYESTWWGFSYPTGFGNIYDQYNNPNTLSKFFILRVEEDGGIVESEECLSSLGLDQYDWEYNNRVQADGGSIEALQCVTI
tara:strand:+ start:592 stop:846 length:255 start_codon:yes stop_codon:yes gene_type:complete